LYILIFMFWDSRREDITTVNTTVVMMAKLEYAENATTSLWTTVSWGYWLHHLILIWRKCHYFVQGRPLTSVLTIASGMAGNESRRYFKSGPLMIDLCYLTCYKKKTSAQA
jgi:hypothetical protein